MISLLAKILAVLALVIACLFPLELQARIVEAKGLSEIDQGKTVEARKIALENAKRAAVEQVVGSFIRARTDVNNFMLSKDKVYSSTAGQIDQYDIIFDDVNEHGAYQIIIRADVRVDILLDQAAELQAIYGWNKKPRVAIIIDENSNDTVVAKMAQAHLSEKLLREGFDIFDENEPVFAGFAIALLASANSHDDEYQGLKLVSNELMLGMTVTRVGDNQVLAASTASERKPGLNKSKAFDSVAKQIVRDEWPQLRRQLLTFWQKEQGTFRNILFEVEGVNTVEDAQQLIAVLEEAIPAIQNTEYSGIKNGVASLVVSYKGWTEQLYQELSASAYAQSKNFEIIGVQGNKISATLF